MALSTPVSLRAQDLFGRGDGDCSITLNAADVTATVRGVGGESLCENDDCDRDGELTAADIDCAARCLFGDCAVPTNAPDVTEVAAEPGQDISPYSTVRVSGANFAVDRSLIGVTIGGVAAEVIEIVSDEEIRVVVPPLPPGPADLVVQSGELGGLRTSIEVAPQSSVGEPDSLDGTLELLDLVLEAFAALDLESVYGDDAAAVREALQAFRDDLAEQRAVIAADPDLTAEMRAELDAAIDSSGVPEALRELLVEIAAILDGGEEAQTSGTVVAIGAAARNLGNTLAVARGAIAIAAGTGLSTAAGLVAVGVGLVGGVLTFGGSAALPPIMTTLTLLDPMGAVSRAVHPDGGRVVVGGRRLLGSNLVIRTPLGEFVLAPEETGDDVRQFRLSPRFGLCGTVEMFLRRSAAPGESQHEYRNVQPVLASFYGVDRIQVGQTLIMDTTAVAGCAASARFYAPNAGPFDFSVAAIRFEDSRTVRATVPILPADAYQVELGVGLLETSRRALQVDNPLSVEVRCALSQLKMSPAAPSATTCNAAVVPSGARPRDSRFVWGLSDPGAAAIEGGGSEIRLVATAPGTTTASCELKLGERVLAADQSPRIQVEDVTGPSVNITTIAAGAVRPGATIPVAIDAWDNVVVTRVVLRAIGDGVLTAVQEFPCTNLESTCATTLNVNLKQDGFANPAFTIMAEAFDGSGNSGVSETRAYTIEAPPDTACPLARITAPLPGTSVNADATVQVVASASDDRDFDTGVKRFRYSASGPALAAQVSQDLAFPTALPNADLRFNFTVRPAAELVNVTDRTVVIRVEAIDEQGNTCGPVVSTAPVVGILNQCQGSITTDNPSGYIDEPFTVTVAISGEVASEIVRVTSINPGGQFDLFPQGNGVYAVTLFYQGQGGFTLSFTAFDAEGESRCMGSIALQALGPNPN